MSRLWSQEIRGWSWTTFWHLPRSARLYPASHTDGAKKGKDQNWGHQGPILHPPCQTSFLQPALSFLTTACSSLTDNQQVGYFQLAKATIKGGKQVKFQMFFWLQTEQLPSGQFFWQGENVNYHNFKFLGAFCLWEKISSWGLKPTV